MAHADRPAAGTLAAGAVATQETDAAEPEPLALPVPQPQEAPVAAAPAPVDLLAALAADPTAHGFYQTMRQLEVRFADRPRFGHSVRPSQDAVRLAQEPSTIFAPSHIAGFEPAQGDRPARLLVHFFGLFGPDGPLPLHLTDYARERRRNARDATFQRFADIFHHRALSLFYRAWADARPTISFDRPQADRFGMYVGALIGLGMDSLRDRDAMPHISKLHFAGLLANQTRHAEGLGAILSAFFTVAVRVESFIGAWLEIPPADRSALGADPRTGGLGRTLLLGRQVWSRQHKFRIVFGPLSLADYVRLLPGGRSFRRLIPIVRNYAGDTLKWDVNMVLHQDEVPQTRLGQQGQLGWTTWLGQRLKQNDAAELFLDASADSMARRIDAALPDSPSSPSFAKVAT